ncbi:hypothetical protein BJ508DRAFT_320738 [Ascobolus immersus RN42]|uniref:Uncharacterized protein n=1 Tax=Ascobolus immersus RN42 TaxID=1160509 RepID=A0A3N4IPU1_ASCIM|nr:hypothetical protein BJ508DRAFT_320738 [Ascobolus immersus RN42]
MAQQAAVALPFQLPFPIPLPYPAPVEQIIAGDHMMGDWHYTNARERALIQWLCIHYPILEEMLAFFNYNLGTISPPSYYQFKIINDGDSDRMKELKTDYNSLLQTLKSASNDELTFDDARKRFTLLTNIETGFRPSGAPWNHRMVIEFTLQQWYELGEGIKLFAHWRQLRVSLGFCRYQWCEFHRVPEILTFVERSDPTRPPPGGWVGYPVPRSVFPLVHLSNP